MQTKKQITQPRKVITVIFLLLGVCFSTFGAGMTPAARAQDIPTSTPTPPVSSDNQNKNATTIGISVSSEPIPSQVIVKFASKASENEKKAFIEGHGGKVVKRIDSLHIMVIQAPNNGKDIKSAKSPLVESIEPDYYISALDDVIPNDPRYPEQWALPAIGAPSAWAQMPADAPKVTVAVIDSGICADHPDLASRILDGWDFLESDAVPQDDFGHGCAVSGVIAANMNDGIGIAGVAPNAQIMPLRVLNAQGVGSYSDVAAAIVYAAENGVQVINLSLGGSNPSTTLENAVNYAISKGVIVVAAAGNNGTEGTLYPAAYPDVIAVGSVDPDLQHSSFSNYGSQIDIWAPGRDILTTRNDGTYELVSGTSFAAPYVAGAAGFYYVLHRSIPMNQGLLDLNSQSIITDTPTAMGNDLALTPGTPTLVTTGPVNLHDQSLIDAANNVIRVINEQSNYISPLRLVKVMSSEGFGVVYAEELDPQTDHAIPGEPIVALAKLNGTNEWNITFGNDPDLFNSLLVQIPPQLIRDDAKKFLIISTFPPSSMAIPSGYQAPWAGGWGGTLVRRHLDNGTTSSSGNNYDFDLWFGDQSAYVGQSGFAVAAKAGTVVYVKEVAPDPDPTNLDPETGLGYRVCDNVGCAGWANVVVIKHSDYEYSWYYHLRSYSVPDDIVVGRYITQGTVIGIEGSTGWSSATHLHFMVSDSFPDPNKINVYETDPDYAPWPGGHIVPFSFADGVSTTGISNNYQPVNNAVVLYWEKNYRGPSYRLSFEEAISGCCDFQPWFNDKASSIYVYPGFSIEVYENMSASGQKITFTSSDIDLSDNYINLNEKITSYRLTTPPPMCLLSLSAASCGGPTPTPIPTQPTATLPPPSDGIEIVSVSSHVVKPGEQFNPSIIIKHVSGELVANRDHLHAIPEDNSNTFGAWPIQPIKSTVPIGGTYTFDFNNDSSFHMTAPTTPGQYQSVWQMRVGGVHIGPQAVINITVKSDPITTPLPTPSIDCSNPPQGITLYEFTDFRGRCINFPTQFSNTDVQYLGNTYFGDNVASSLRVVGNWGATLFRDADWTGSWEEFQGNDNNLSDNQIGDNTVSSLRVWEPGNLCGTFQGVILYRGRDFTGISQSFSKDAQFFGNETIGDNTVNSLRICGPYKVTLYRDPDWVGVKEDFTGSDSNLTDNPINDPNATASSLRIIDVINPCNTLPPGVTLYKETDFNGDKATFSSDVQYLGNTSFGNDAAKSLRVCGHWTVTVFRDADWTGTWANFTGEVRELALTTIGTSASSIRMVDSYDFCKTLGPGVTLYRGRDFTGIAQTFTNDVSFLGNTNIGDNNVTAIRQCGYNSRLYPDPDWNGTPEEFTGREESNLTDNQISGKASSLRVWTIPPTPWPTITPTPTPVPAKSDLVPYDGNGSFPLVPSSAPGDHWVGMLYAGQVTYLDWSIFNNSNVNVTTPFKVTLFLDGVQINQFSYTSLDADAYHGIDDWNIYVDTPGYHILKITVDSNNEIAETNETNNSWEGSFYWNPKPVTLTVTKTGFGSGTVTSNPAGINCGSDCSYVYPYNKSVSLTATPATGSAFYGWGGPCTGSHGCDITMTNVQSVTANFSKPGDANNDGEVDYLDLVIWQNHYGQQTFNGPADGDFDNDGIVRSSDLLIWSPNATFYTLTVSLAGTGNGTVTSNPAGINCPGDCSETYASRTPVTLTANPSTGSTFSSWSGFNSCLPIGACPDANLQLTITQNTAVTANFIVNCYTLTRAHTGSGSDPIASPTNSSGCSAGQYHLGESITLTASPANGWAVSGWNGTNNDLSTLTTNTLTMPAASRMVTVNFSCTGCGPANSPWPLYRQNALRSGRSSYSGPATSPGVLWSYDAFSYDGSSPAIGTDGTIYVGLSNKLYAFYPSGGIKWTYTAGGLVRSPAIAANGTVYATADDGKLYALNANGVLKWSFTTGGWISDSPALSPEGIIYFGSSDGKLYALWPDGTLKWSYTIGHWQNPSPAIGTDGTIYQASTNWNVYALSPAGQLKWQYRTGNYIDASPAIGADGTIYIGSLDHSLYALKPDGTLKWSYATGDEVGTPAVGADGTIYVGSRDSYLHALNQNGTLKWKYLIGDYVHTPSVDSEGTIYVGSNDGYLYAINPSGSLKWRILLGGWVDSNPVFGANHTIYITSGGKLFALGSCYSLNININPGGSGSVKATPAPNCNNGTQYTLGTVVQLSGAPNLNYNFTGWSNGECSGLGACSVTMDSDKLITANFIMSPSLPTLITPKDGEIITNYAPKLDWIDQNPAPDHYEVQISQVAAGVTSCTFNSVLYDESVTTSEFTLPQPLLPGKTSCWRVRAFNGIGQASAWSTARNFKTGWLPPTFLYTPSNGEQLLHKRPTFSWEAVPYAASYNIQVSLYANFSTLQINATTTSTSFTPSADLKAGSIYYWRVRTNGTNGPSVWAGPLSFNTGTPPSIPVLSLPANGSLNTNYMPTLKWSVVTSSVTFDHYQVQVDDDPLFGSPAVDDSSHTISSQNQIITPALSPNTKFYWRVLAFNSLEQYSTSAVWSFRTALLPVSLDALPNGDHPYTLRPTFTWSDPNMAPLATSYTIQIASVSTFATLITSGTAPAGASSYIPGVNLPGGKLLYWRMRANGVNGPSLWATGSFTTPTPPSIAALLLPANASLNTNYTPTLKWSVVTSVVVFNLYQVQVDDDPLFGSPVVDDFTHKLASQNQLTIPSLTPNTKFYWRVLAYNINGQYSTSAVWSFRTALLPVSLNALQNNDHPYTLRPTFTWNDPNTAPFATSYSIQIAAVGNFSTLLTSGTTTAGTTSFTPTVNLPAGKTLYWRVRANGVNGPSLWSSRSFTSPTPPSTATLLLPANSSLNTNYMPTLKWSVVTSAVPFDHYQVQVDDDPLFGSPVVNDVTHTLTAQNQLITPSLPHNTRFYWRVLAFNNLGQYSTSAVWSFRTRLDAPTLLTPNNGVPTGTLKPVFDWAAPTGPVTSYTIQVATSPTFGTLLVNSTTVDSTYARLTNFPVGKTLYWRVRANGANGPSAWSSAFSFTTP